MALSASAPHAVNERAAGLRDPWLWGGVVFYAAIYFAFGYVRYRAHRNFVDLGIFAQTAASAFGCFCNTVEGSHWAFHFSPILYLAGALMRVWPSALSLIALQALAGAMTVPAVYGIAIRHTDRKAARLCALVVLLYPPLAGVIFNDFHENGLAPAAVAWLLWAFDGGFIGWTAFFTALTLSIKEDQALFAACAGVIAAFGYRSDPLRRRLALGVALASALVFALYFAVVQPHAAAGASWSPTRFYAWNAADVGALLHGGILARAGFLLLAFVPLLFIPFRVPAALLLIAPFAEVLASDMSTTYTMGSHYAGAWCGWLLYAFTLGIVAMWRRDKGRAYRSLYWCAALCVVEFAAADPLHPGYFLRPVRGRDVALDRFLSTLPPHIDVATQEEAYTHMAATDPNAAVLPQTSATALDTCYLLTDSAFAHSPRLVESRAAVARAVSHGTYVVVRRDGAITLYASRRCATSKKAAPRAPLQQRRPSPAASA